MYYLFDEEENRVRVEDKTTSCVVSGILGLMQTSFKPVEYNSKWYARWKGLGYGLHPVKVYYEEFNREINPCKYVWVKFKDTSKSENVIKLYTGYYRKPPLNCSQLIDSKVMIKGIGVFPKEDFYQVVF